jgi:type IV pilus assembly protein PilQ
VNLFWLWLLTGLASAGPSPIPDFIPPGTSDAFVVPGAEPVSLDLMSADIHGVLRFFGQVSGLNIVAGDDVSGTVTLQLTDIPWDQALQIVLLSQGLQVVWMDTGALWIRPLGQVKTLAH